MKRIIILFVAILISVSCEAQFYGLNQNAQIPPLYVAATALVSDSDSDVDIPYPVGFLSGDVLVIVAGSKNDEAWQSLTAQGFTVLAPARYNVNFSYATWYRRADGTETGTVDVGISDVTGFVAGVMYAYREIKSLTNPQSPASSNVVQAVDQGSSISANTNDLGVEVWAIAGSLTATGGALGWVEDSNLTTSDNTGFTFVAASYLFPSTGTSTTPVYPGVNSYNGFAEFYLLK